MQTIPCCGSVAGMLASVRAPLSCRFSSFHGGHRLGAVPQSCSHCRERGSLQVVAGKAKGKARMRTGGAGSMQAPPAPPTPEVDPANAEFVIFVRSTKLPQWCPLSVVKGGQAANLLIRSMDSPWGLKMFGNTLVRNIATVIYQDRATLERQIRKNIPPLANTTEFQFGFKIRDKARPKDWYKTTGVTVLPPPNKIPGTALDNIRSFFSTVSVGGLPA